MPWKYVECCNYTIPEYSPELLYSLPEDIDLIQHNRLLRTIEMDIIIDQV